MDRINFKQIFAGIATSLFVMMFLIIASQMKFIKTVATDISKNLDTELAKPISSSGEFNKPNVPENIIAGTFNTQTEGNIVYADETNPERKFHYKAIRSDKLKSKNVGIRLMIQVQNEDSRSWKETDWSWIDQDQGILYFFFAAEENGQTRTAENFTGSYQLVFN